MLLAALLAVLALAAIPAIAQVTQEGEQEGESAELDQTHSGDNSTSCVNDQLTGNTGNAQTLNQALEYGSEGSPSPSGSSTITLTPNEDVQDVFTCTPMVQQAASASGSG